MEYSASRSDGYHKLETEFAQVIQILMLQVPNFWAPTQMVVGGETHEVALPVSQTKMNLPNSEGFTYEVQHVRDCILKGTLYCTSIESVDDWVEFNIL